MPAHRLNPPWRWEAEWVDEGIPYCLAGEHWRDATDLVDEGSLEREEGWDLLRPLCFASLSE